MTVTVVRCRRRKPGVEDPNDRPGLAVRTFFTRSSAALRAAAGGRKLPLRSRAPAGEIGERPPSAEAGSNLSGRAAVRWPRRSTTSSDWVRPTYASARPAFDGPTPGARSSSGADGSEEMRPPSSLVSRSVDRSVNLTHC